MAAHSSILAWRIPWTEELGGLQSMGSQRVRHDCMTNTFTFFQVLILHHLHRVPPYTRNLDTLSELSGGSHFQLFAPYLQPDDTPPTRKCSMKSHGHAFLSDFIPSSLTSACPMDFTCCCKNNP